MKCPFCEKICKQKRSLTQHTNYCKHNPYKKIHTNNGRKLGKPAWNKGLTKYDDERVRVNAENLSKTLKDNYSKGIYPKNSWADPDYWTEDKRKEKSIWRIELHKKFPEMHPNRKLAGNRNKMTYPERVAFDWLTKHNIQFKSQEKVGSYYPDFIVNKNIIIEIDGERWHDKEKDKKRDEFLRNKGFKIYRINSKEKIENMLMHIMITERILSEKL